VGNRSLHDSGEEMRGRRRTTGEVFGNRKHRESIELGYVCCKTRRKFRFDRYLSRSGSGIERRPS
jgi:hypothetical protein